VSSSTVTVTLEPTGTSSATDTPSARIHPQAEDDDVGALDGVQRADDVGPPCGVGWVVSSDRTTQ
jgi:hypothetical protein